jgi:hypothetical protein
MKIFFTSDFFNQATRLIKKSKDGYQSCLEDIITAISNASTNDLITGNPVLLEQSPLYLVKIRIPNSFQKLSKRDGFRLIAIIDSEAKTLTLVFIFPKAGKHGQGNISQKDELIFFNNYLDEEEAGTLKSFDYDLPGFLDYFKR